MKKAGVQDLGSSRFNTTSPPASRPARNFQSQYVPLSASYVDPSAFPPEEFVLPFSPFPMATPQPIGPVVRTILVPDVNNPGRHVEVTGMEVVGHVPLVAHQPLPSSHSMHQENAAPQSLLQPNLPISGPFASLDRGFPQRQLPQKSLPPASTDGSRSPLSPRNK